jgi:uncharacterized membrane protein YhaH (DUF805 family)
MTINLRDCFDPRGRADRKGLAMIAGALIVVQSVGYGALMALGLSLQGLAANFIHIFFCAVTMIAVTKRLHDLGRSGWWVLAAVAAWIAWTVVVVFAIVFGFGPEAVEGEGAMMGPAFLMSVVAALAPLLCGAVWLHCARGEPGTNRFGPAPGATGLSHPNPRTFAASAVRAHSRLTGSLEVPLR